MASARLRDAAARLARVADPLAPPLCVCCGAHAGRAEPLCGECRRAMRWLPAEQEPLGGVALWAPAAYQGPARALVSRLKFEGAASLAGTMAAQVVARAPTGWLSDAVFVPVPIHPARRRRRGFNQAELLAAAIAARKGLGLSDCLARVVSVTTQTGRSRAERARAIEGAVETRSDALLPARVLLVDDVVTTGATLAACAAALWRTGARSVRAVAYARTPGR